MGSSTCVMVFILCVPWNNIVPLLNSGLSGGLQNLMKCLLLGRRPTNEALPGLKIHLFWHYSSLDPTPRFLSMLLTLSHSSSKELSRSWPQVLLNVTFRPWMFSTLGRMMSVSWAHSILNILFTPLSASLFLSDFLGKNHKHNC